MTRPITIVPVLNGWVITAGCQQVVFNDRAAMLKALDEYYANPDAVEKRYMERPTNQVQPQAPEPIGAVPAPANVAGIRAPDVDRLR